MSTHFVSWARRQKTGSGKNKSILVFLADSANTAGVSWWPQEKLAEESEYSVDTLQRALKDLEARGFIYRLPQSRRKDYASDPRLTPDEGRRGTTPGSFGSCCTIVLMDSVSISMAEKYGYDPAEIRKQAPDAEEYVGKQEDTETAVPPFAVRPNSECNEINQLAECAQAGHTANCGAAISSENGAEKTGETAICGADRAATVQHGIYNDLTVNNKTLSPLNPPSRLRHSELAEGSWLAEWGTLIRSYPNPKGEALDRAREKFRVMPPEDRGDVLIAAGNYIGDRNLRKSAPMSLRSFLSGDNWRIWVSQTRAPDVFVFKDTPAFHAWQAYKRATGAIGPGQKLFTVWSDAKRGHGCYVPTLLPPELPKQSSQADLNEVTL